MNLSDIKKIMKIIVFAPVILMYWLLMQNLKENCWRCRAMMESDSNLGYGIRSWVPPEHKETSK